jgi:hypothetical protein
MIEKEYSDFLVRYGAIVSASMNPVRRLIPINLTW